MQNVFICLDKEFPRKNAPANYVEYLGKALRSEETAVYFISIASKKNECNQWFQYQKMKYCNVYYDVSTPLKTAKARLKVGLDMWKCMISQQISEGDVIICYTDNYFMMKTLWANGRKKKVKVINCVAEWYLAHQYKYGYFDVFNYWYDCLGFYRGVGCGKKVIAISRKIDSYFRSKGCKTFILPPLIDPFEFPYHKEKKCDKVRFVYAGNFSNKDSMGNMLLGIAGLDEEKREQIEFHITGGNREGLNRVIAELGNEWKKIAECVIIHDWLSYEELINLYQRMHFLLLTRPDNRVTQSNFPSKVPEMMSYGIIPVMNRVGDCPNYYLEDGKDSLLFDACDADSCRKAISRAMTLSSEQRISMQNYARAKAENTFYYDVWREKIKAFLTE